MSLISEETFVKEKQTTSREAPEDGWREEGWGEEDERNEGGQTEEGGMKNRGGLLFKGECLEFLPTLL